MALGTFSQQYQIPETPDVHHIQMANDQFVRRNSISLRSPPACSLAGELLNAANSTPAQHYEKAKNIISGLKQMTEQFTDFASAQESLASSSGSENEEFTN